MGETDAVGEAAWGGEAVTGGVGGGTRFAFGRNRPLGFFLSLRRAARRWARADIVLLLEQAKFALHLECTGRNQGFWGAVLANY